MNINVTDRTTKANNLVSFIPDSQKDDFKKLFDKITGGDIAEEIRKKYNVSLHIENIATYGKLSDNCNIGCINYVQFSSETLSKMEKDSALKQRVLKKIEEFCSPEEQAEVRALQPPVKSAGMIIYPDGNVLYWLEGYPNEAEIGRYKNIVNEKSLYDLFQQYRNENYQMTENNVELSMQILATGLIGKQQI